MASDTLFRVVRPSTLRSIDSSSTGDNLAGCRLSSQLSGIRNVWALVRMLVPSPPARPDTDLQMALVHDVKLVGQLGHECFRYRRAAASSAAADNDVVRHLIRKRMTSPLRRRHTPSSVAMIDRKRTNSRATGRTCCCCNTNDSSHVTIRRNIIVRSRDTPNIETENIRNID